MKKKAAKRRTTTTQTAEKPLADEVDQQWRDHLAAHPWRVLKADDPEWELRLLLLEQLWEIRNCCVAGEWELAARRLFRMFHYAGMEPVDDGGAQSRVREVMQAFWNASLYLEMLALLLPREVFEPRPEIVRRIFCSLRDEDKLILQGAAGCSKTMSTCAFLWADFWGDPENTTTVLTSVKAQHVRANVWSNFWTFHERSLFDPAGGVEINASNMTLLPINARPEIGVSVLLFPKSQEGTGSLKGYHPKPFRNPPHLVFGALTRVRMLLDDAQNITDGLFKDLDSPLGSLNRENHIVKIICTMNPEEEARRIVKMAEAQWGWAEEKMDTQLDWESRAGWHVTRLDAAKVENVVQKREVFPGFMRYDAFVSYMAGSTTSASYYSMARGWPPPGMANEVVVPSRWYDDQRGEPIFVGPVVDLAALDLGFSKKGDPAILAKGRYGLASGWTDAQGQVHQFTSRQTDGQLETRHCCCVDQLLHLQSQDPTAAAMETIILCERLGVEPRWLAVDATGSGFGTASYLERQWGQILSVNWNEAPTKIKILIDDKEGAIGQAVDIISEMALTVRNWMEPRTRALWINPIIQDKELRQDFTGRRFKQKDTSYYRFEVERKAAFKGRFGRSSDSGDAVGMMALLARVRGLALPARTNESAAKSAKDSRTRLRDGRMEDFTTDETVTLGPSVVWISPDGFDQ